MYVLVVAFIYLAVGRGGSSGVVPPRQAGGDILPCALELDL